MAAVAFGGGGRPATGALHVAFALLLLVPLSGCGYALAGRGSFLPAYIQTIGVPTFVNHTSVYDMERVVSERVRSEFIGRGRYKVFPEREGHDALLLGEITSIVSTPSAFNQQNQATRYALILTAKIEFRDMRADKVLWENPAMQFREEFEVTSGVIADPTAFFGQDINARDRLAQEFARSIVSAILEAF
ncbi:MAG: LptE family protein, partial [Acidobacteria bacterium]|nr:LptE family protein [Acidobacteriota bacterium]